MARPVKRRRICQIPRCRQFLPADGGMAEGVTITLDEFEALRLIDYMGLNQEECARQMMVARTTVQAVYNSARQKMADALVCGKRLDIDGGTYDLCPDTDTCCGKHCRKRGCPNRQCEAGGTEPPHGCPGCQVTVPRSGR